MSQSIQIAIQHHQAGRLAEAEKIYREILARQPNHPDAANLLGMLVAQTGRLDAAVELFGRAVRVKPDFFDAHHNLANALRHLGRLDEAILSYQQAIRIKSDFAVVHNNLGVALAKAGRLDESIASFRRAIGFKPDYATAHSNLGNALKDVGPLDEALAACRAAIRLQPDYAEAHNNLGIVLKGLGRLDESIAAYRQAIQLRPDYAAAHNNLGNALKTMGQLDEAVVSFRRVIQLEPEFAEAHSNLVLALNYQPDRDAGEILAEHRAWADRYAPPLSDETIPHVNERSPERRLRIGYVSADFRQHSVGHFFMPLLEHYDRGNLEIFCYSNAPHLDGMSEKMKRSCDAWRDLGGTSDEAVARLIRSDGIDILVDLSGHTSGNRLRVFARKPAPIQVTYLGYPNTTGLSAIDYRLTDALADPPGVTDHLNVEKLWRLPVCAWCYEPPEDSPDIEARGSGPVTFGCFNAFAKINPRITAIWVELLKQAAGSRLLLKSAGAGEVSARRRIVGQFEAHGVSSERIEMLGWVDRPRRHLELYKRVDVALDTYPYHGTTTTCEALWMGIPVVSLAGRCHVSRVGASLLSCVGLPELIARSAEEYVSIAAGLAKDLPRLAELRGTLRARMRGSPLMDGKRFARDIEQAYRQMWRNWCAGGGG